MFLFMGLSAIDDSLAQKLTDEIIIDVGRDSTKAFRTLYELTDKAVYGYALSILKNIQDAEDAMQDTYIRIRETAHNYRPCGKPMAWILTITRNLCLMRLRSRGRTVEIASEQMENDEKLSYSINTEDKLVLMTALSVLSQEERQIVILHVVAGLKHREIGELLESPVGSVLAKYHRALKKLKKQIH